MTLSRVSFGVICLVLLVAGLFFGFLAGFFARKPVTGSDPDLLQLLTREADDTISEKLIEEVRAENIKEYLR